MYFLLSTFPQFIFVTCPCKNISCYGHCVTSQDGVHDFDCYGKLSKYKTDWECAWKPGKYSLNTTTYRLIIEQDPNCKMFAGISGMSQIITNMFYKHKDKDMTAHVLEENGPGDCTVASSFQHFVRCGPPSEVKLIRQSRKLYMGVSWRKEETERRKGIKMYNVRYRTLGSHSWEESALSNNLTSCTLGNLNSSLAYEMQIQCVQSESCTQCPWSEVFTVRPELTRKPIIEKIEEIAQTKGQRLLIIKWTFADAELAKGYRVTVGKASGESPREKINTTGLEIRLVLSHSAYHISVMAFHDATTSPAAESTIAPLVDRDLAAGRLNVTFTGNSSFTISWQYDLIKTYSCYSVEWWRKGDKAAHKSFFENENNYEVIASEEPLKPYQKYTFILYTRPHRMSCNLKFINNSESTYGSVQAYFTEGRPISGPGNISSSNVTQSSLLIEWSPISEEDTRGFLQGYLIFYTENQLAGAATETNITMDPRSNHYELVDLKSSTVYRVQMSAFTKRGVGVRSSAVYFETKPPDSLPLGGTITGLIVLATVLIFGVHLISRLLKRVKKVLWPSMPNPSNSSAIQGVEGVCGLELLEPINTQKLEDEGDSNSLHVIERGADIPNVRNLYSSVDPNLPCNRESEDHRETTPLLARLSPSTGLRCVPVCQRDFPSTTTERSEGDPTSNNTTPPSTDTRHTDPVPNQANVHQSPTVVFMSDYTTMEHFQQTMPPCCPPASTPADMQVQTSQSEDTDLTSRLDYAHQSPYLSPQELGSCTFEGILRNC